MDKLISYFRICWLLNLNAIVLLIFSNLFAQPESSIKQLKLVDGVWLSIDMDIEQFESGNLFYEILFLIDERNPNCQPKTKKQLKQCVWLYKSFVSYFFTTAGQWQKCSLKQNNFMHFNYYDKFIVHLTSSLKNLSFKSPTLLQLNVFVMRETKK